MTVNVGRVHNIFTVSGYDEDDNRAQIGYGNGARAGRDIEWLSRDLAKLRKCVGGQWQRVAQSEPDLRVSDDDFSDCDKDSVFDEFDCYGGEYDLDEYDCGDQGDDKEGGLYDDVDEHWSTGL